MKPLFEKITVPDNASWVLLHRLLTDGIPFEWHYHPEFELTLTLNSRGQRFVGDHVADYDDSDLVLMGPNLPHTWESREAICPSKPHEAIVIWLEPDWISSLCREIPELEDVQRILQSSVRGLAFGPQTVEAVRPLASSLPSLSFLDRIPVLLAILARLAQERSPQILASCSARGLGPVVHRNSGEQDRLERVLGHVHRNYRQELDLEDLAGIACLSTSALTRSFKRTTGLTIGEYTKRLRVGRACAMLIDDQYSIAGIATEVGYNNLSNFNRQFLAEKGMAPSRFRKVYRDKFRLAAAPHKLVNENVI